jgi:hypothetical protein
VPFSRRWKVIVEKLKELYEQYSSSDEHFVRCGVVNEEAYESRSPKLVFVLKEPNDPNHRLRSMVPTNQVKRGLSGQTMFRIWKAVGIWSYGIHNGFPTYEEISTVQSSAQGLNWVGVTNLKKSGGTGTSNYRVIREHATRTIELWKSELEIMGPDIIICCGTYRIVTDLLRLKKLPTTAGLSYSIWKRDSGDILLLRSYHPASRFAKGVVYARLKEALLELHERGFWRS